MFLWAEHIWKIMVVKNDNNIHGLAVFSFVGVSSAIMAIHILINQVYYSKVFGTYHGSL
jgi:hypothetical protein